MCEIKVQCIIDEKLLSVMLHSLEKLYFIVISSQDENFKIHLYEGESSQRLNKMI